MSRTWSRNRNTVAHASTVKLGPVMHTIVIAMMVAVLGLIYLTQATKTTAYDYQSNEIDQKISQLAEQKQNLEIDNAKLASLDTVKNSDVAKAMTSSSTTEYDNN